MWLLGVQREANEIERTLKNIPANMKKPKPADIAHLKLGQFFVCFGEHIYRTYIWPKWMTEVEAHSVATSGARPATKPQSDPPPSITYRKPEPEEDPMDAAQLDQARREGQEAGYQKGFDKGYEAASATLNGQLAGVIKTAAAFMDELKRLSAQLARTLSDNPPGSRAAISDAVRAADGGTDIDAKPDLDWHSGEDIPPAPKKKRAASEGPNPAHKPACDKLLAALIRYGTQGLTWDQAAIIAGMPNGNGYFYGGRKYAVEKGYAIEKGERAIITTEGRKQVEKGRPLGLGDIVALWSAKLRSPGGEMLQVLAKHPGKGYTTEQFAAATRIKPGNGHWYGGIKAMTRHGLAEKSGDTIALSTFLQDAAQQG